VCPTGASYQREDGITLVNYEDCINCGSCVPACPYGARHANKGGKFAFGEDNPAPYEEIGAKRASVMEKCIFCYELVDNGGQPACVVNCPGKARFFGDLDNPESPVAQKIAKGNAKQVGATGFYYVENSGMPAGMVASKVMASGAPVDNGSSDTAEDSGAKKAQPGINPAIIGGGVAVAAAAAVGAGVYVSKKKKNAAKPTADAKNGGAKDDK
jgi:Fe-S-cluster-containing hydrogenase component 2